MLRGLKSSVYVGPVLGSDGSAGNFLPVRFCISILSTSRLNLFILMRGFMLWRQLSACCIIFRFVRFIDAADG